MYTAVYTARTRAVYTTVFASRTRPWHVWYTARTQPCTWAGINGLCTRPCTRSVHGPVHDHVHGPYARSCTRVHGPYFLTNCCDYTRKQNKAPFCFSPEIYWSKTASWIKILYLLTGPIYAVCRPITKTPSITNCRVTRPIVHTLSYSNFSLKIGYDGNDP